MDMNRNGERPRGAIAYTSVEQFAQIGLFHKETGVWEKPIGTAWSLYSQSTSPKCLCSGDAIIRLDGEGIDLSVGVKVILVNQ